MKLLRLSIASVLASAALFASGHASIQAAPARQDDELGLIEGSVFLDEDSDGRFDPEEKPLSGFEVRLEGADERSAVTTTNGRYRFEDLPAGEYTVSVERNDAQRETYASSIRYQDLKVDGTLLVGIDFGLQERDALAAAATEDAKDEEEASATSEADAGDDEDMADDASDDEEMADDEDMADDASDDEEMADDEDMADDAATTDELPAMTAANMLPALREMLESADSAGQTVDDLDPAARKALEDAVAELSPAERAELVRAVAEDEELARLARSTGADKLIGADAVGGATMDGMKADAASAAPTTSSQAQVSDMPQAGAEDLFGWPALVALIVAMAIMGALGMAAERRGA